MASMRRLWEKALAEGDELTVKVISLRSELAAATRRCSDCGRGSKVLKPWHDEAGQVVAWLGPSCHRRRLDGQHATALPIGGGS